MSINIILLEKRTFFNIVQTISYRYMSHHYMCNYITYFTIAINGCTVLFVSLWCHIFTWLFVDCLTLSLPCGVKTNQIFIHRNSIRGSKLKNYDTEENCNSVTQKYVTLILYCNPEIYYIILYLCSERVNSICILQ